MIRTNKRVAIYARYSSDNQRSESIDAQLRAMQEYCQNHKYIIVETYIDEAKSGTNDRRPAFQQMITDSNKKTFDILLVHKLDRFARNRYDSAVYKRELKKNGITVCSVLENLDDSPESVMMESVLEGMNEYYSQNLAREVMKGLKETALQCKHTGGLPPLGYDVDPQTKRLVLNESEAETVRLIFQMYADGQGYSSILDTLHEANRKTKRGQEFGKNSLYGILSNPKYAGQYVYNRSAAKSPIGTRNSHLYKEEEDVIVIEGGCPEIVDERTFSQVQHRMADNRHAGQRNTTKRTYLLSGKVFCKECGKRMVGNFRHCGNTKAAYTTCRCMSKRYCCCNKEINQGYLDQYVIKTLEQEIFSPTAMTRLIQSIDRQRLPNARAKEQELANLNTSLQETNKALENVADAVASGLLSDALIQRLNLLEEQKAQLEAKRTRLLSEEAQKETDIDPHLIPAEYENLKHSPTLPAYRDFVLGFIDRIDVGRYTVNICLKTGLDVCPSLDKALTARRQEVYST